MQTSNHQRTKTGRFQARAAGMTFLAVIYFHTVGGMSASGGEAVTDRAADRLSAEAFAEPPLHARPGSFWDWLNGSITKEQITRDLTAMKEVGMRGGEIWDVAAYADPDGRVPAGPPFLGPESTRLIVHAIHEADRLGLEIGIVASSGWNVGGSWIPPEHAGKGLYHSATAVTGPKQVQLELPLPDLPRECPRDPGGRPVYLREVAVLAVPRHPAKVLSGVDIRPCATCRRSRSWTVWLQATTTMFVPPR